MRTTSFLSVLATALLSCQLYAQPTGTTPATPPPATITPVAKVDHSYKPLTLKLNEDGSKYVRFIMWHQFWATATQNNPDTKDAQGNLIDGSEGSDKSWSTDLALRRSRFLAYAQISPRCMILTHWGINNQSFINGATAPNGTNPTTAVGNQGKKPQLFIHDAWTEYELVKNKLYIGAGLHYFNGVTRLSSNSTLNFMTLDAPIFNWHNIEATDQFGRQLGFYAKGQLGRLDYRLALNKPFCQWCGCLQRLQKTEWRSMCSMKTGRQPVMSTGCSGIKKATNCHFTSVPTWAAKKVLNVGAGFLQPPKGASLYKTADGRDSMFPEPDGYRSRHFPRYAVEQGQRHCPERAGYLLQF